MPRTDAGRNIFARGSNNWIGSGWLERFAADIALVEAEAHAQGRAEALAAVRAAVDGLPYLPIGATKWDMADFRLKVLAAIDNLETT